MRRTAFIFCTGMFIAGALSAQEVTPFTFAFGAGYTNSLGSAGRYLDNGWDVQGGAGYNFNSHLTAMFDFNFTSMGINSATLSNLGAPDGDVHVMSFTIDPMVHVIRKGPLDLYLVGGGGLYHRYDALTAPSVTFAPIVTPLGFFNAPVAGETVLSSYSINKPGFNAGAGISLGTRWNAKFYAEARYHRMFTSVPTDYIPVTFGVRW
jgi:hypothetical protein